MSVATRALLTRHSLRATRGRLDILDILRQASEPLSASDVHGRLGSSRPDLATVYRSLERFASLRIVRGVLLNDGVRRFEMTDRIHHHHLICNQCGAVQDLPACDVKPLESAAREQFGFQVSDHSLEFFGTCRRCQPRRR